MPEIHSAFTRSLEPRFGTVRLQVVAKIEEDAESSIFFSDTEIETVVRKWFSSQPETFFIGGMKKWIERLKNV
jgi:hypothetical protein